MSYFSVGFYMHLQQSEAHMCKLYWDPRSDHLIEQSFGKKKKKTEQNKTKKKYFQRNSIRINAMNGIIMKGCL